MSNWAYYHDWPAIAIKEFKAMVEAEGYYTAVCYGHEAAASYLIQYLALGEFRG